MSPNIKGIIFDAGGVIVKRMYPTVFGHLSRTLGVNRKKLENAMWEFIPDLQSGKLNEKEFWQKVSRRIGENLPLKKCKLEWRKAAHSIKNDNRVLKLVRTLKKRGYVLVLLTNTVEPHAEVARRIGRYKDFDYVFMSHEVGLRKPHRKLFSLVCKRIKLRPRECLFIDDKPEHVSTARNFGFIAISFTGIGKFKADLRRLAVL